MFIWEWVTIAFGWLIFLLLISFIFLFIKNLNKEFKNRKQVIRHLDLQE